MKIGLVGESPHDTKSVSNLLKRIYPGFSFIDMIPDIHGSQLDQMQPTKARLRLEFQFEKPDLVIFIRDLDALKKDFAQYRKRVSYFQEFRTVVNKKAIFLLFIWEIEALILCDLKSFNIMYNCDCSNEIDPHEVEAPKEVLKKLNHKYSQVHNPEIFNKLDVEKIKTTSKYFSDFLKKVDNFFQN